MGRTTELAARLRARARALTRRRLTDTRGCDSVRRGAVVRDTRRRLVRTRHSDTRLHSVMLLRQPSHILGRNCAVLAGSGSGRVLADDARLFPRRAVRVILGSNGTGTRVISIGARGGAARVSSVPDWPCGGVWQLLPCLLAYALGVEAHCSCPCSRTRGDHPGGLWNDLQCSGGRYN